MEEQNFLDNKKILVYTDGGARGNPGPAACGYAINGKGYGEFLGIKTNNQAEYQGLISALKKVKSLVGKDQSKKIEVEVRMDSELIVRQMNNQYKISDEKMQIMYVEVHNLTLDFKKVNFIHVPREQNKLADTMVNDALDQNL